MTPKDTLEKVIIFYVSRVPLGSKKMEKEFSKYLDNAYKALESGLIAETVLNLLRFYQSANRVELLNSNFFGLPNKLGQDYIEIINMLVREAKTRGYPGLNKTPNQKGGDISIPLMVGIFGISVSAVLALIYIIKWLTRSPAPPNYIQSVENIPVERIRSQYDVATLSKPHSGAYTGCPPEVPILCPAGTPATGKCRYELDQCYDVGMKLERRVQDVSKSDLDRLKYLREPAAQIWLKRKNYPVDIKIPRATLPPSPLR